MIQNPPSSGISSVSTIAKIALVMLVVEILIMLGFSWFEIESLGWQLAIMDAGLLAVIVALIAYFALIRPRDRQIQAVIMTISN
jgi:hypothetical protein